MTTRVFSGPVLAQHGAFLLDGQPCAFEIVSADTTSMSACGTGNSEIAREKKKQL